MITLLIIAVVAVLIYICYEYKTVGHYDPVSFVIPYVPHGAPVRSVITEPVRQTIIMRTDLNMRKGKMCSQSAHSSNGFMNKIIMNEKVLNDIEYHWLNNGHTKICLGVDSEEQLDKLFNDAKSAGLEVYMVTDSGKTEFKEPTKTCIAIGPDLKEKIDLITAGLKLI